MKDFNLEFLMNKKIILTLSCLVSLSAMGRDFSPKMDPASDFGPNTLAVLGALQAELGIVQVDQVIPEKKEEKKVTPPEIVVEPTPIPKPTPKVLSRGEQKVQEMLKANREKLKQQRAIEANNQDSSKESASSDLRTQYLNGLNHLKKQNEQTLKQWRSEVSETYSRWNKQQKDFLSRLSQYKENTFSLGSVAAAYKSSASSVKLGASKVNAKEMWLLPRALEVPVRDQAQRPTCAAFVGVRAFEVLFAQHDVNVDLSEQYFYWASKPKCERAPCTDRGSWVSAALEGTKRGDKAIPLEQDCPYEISALPGNETQIPLKQACLSRGVAMAREFQTLSSASEIRTALEKNMPVMAGFTLTPNFYTNKGLVTLSESKTTGKMDSHSQGHALLLVGYMKMPAAKRSEGELCYIASNSWSEGWGLGGYACLTEAWVKKNLIAQTLMTLQSVRLVD
jgi:C1A family cysteine protease